MRELRLEPSLKVGVEVIDQEHQAIVDLINETQQVIDSGEPQTDLVHVLNRLSDMTVQHFTTEEVLMLETGYPDLHQHKKLHDISIHRTFEFDASRLTTEPDAGKELLELLRDWLLSHIHADREMAQFLREQGVG